MKDNKKGQQAMMKFELDRLTGHTSTPEEFDLVEAWYEKNNAAKEDAARVWKTLFLKSAKEREQRTPTACELLAAASETAFLRETCYWRNGYGRGFAIVPDERETFRGFTRVHSWIVYELKRGGKEGVRRVRFGKLWACGTFRTFAQLEAGEI